METHDVIASALSRARQALAVLEGQAAGYTTLTIPPHLVIELDEKRKEVTRLEERLSAKAYDVGLNPAALPPRDLFFGREEEKEAIFKALSPDRRGWGAIIDGIGGIGKTALAVEIAYICQERHLFDLVLFATAKQTRLLPGGEVALRNTPTLDGLLDTCARALGAPTVTRSAGAEKQIALLTVLRTEGRLGHRILLIFDNLETLPNVEQQAAVEFMLDLPGNSKGIITSRKSLGDGATYLRLERLEWDDARKLIEAEAGRASNLKNILDEAGKIRWQELYDATGGSPLALRQMLGLMRQRNLSLDKALERLRNLPADSDLIQFIYREARAEMGMNDWRVLGALSLFASAASFEHLAAVTTLPRLELESTLERLQAYSLVDASNSDGPYGVHPLTRRFAAAELQTDPVINRELQLRFVEVWKDYAEKYGGPSKNYRNFPTLEKEWPNVQAAIGILWMLSGIGSASLDETLSRSLVAMVSTVDTCLYFRGYWDACLEINSWAYEGATALKDWPACSARADRMAVIFGERGQNDDQTRWRGRSDDARGQIVPKDNLATWERARAAQKQREYSRAQQLYTESVEEFRRSGDNFSVNILLADQGFIASEQKHYDGALEYYLKALKAAEESGDLEHQMWRNHSIGMIYRDYMKDRTKAARYFRNAVTLARELGHVNRIAFELWNLAITLEPEDKPGALSAAQESLKIYEQLRHRNVGAVKALVKRLE